MARAGPAQPRVDARGDRGHAQTTAVAAQPVQTRATQTALAGLSGDEVATAVRILYGGSVKPGNAAELFSQGNIDGGLIGGASLDAESFLGIVRAG